MRLTLNGAASPAGSGAFEPYPGNRFVIVDVTVENTGSTAVDLPPPLVETTLKDAEGFGYAVDISASAVAGPAPEGTLAAGEKVRGEVGFQAPQGAKGLVFVYDATTIGVSRVFFAIP